MLPPGAPISGFSDRSGARPYELKEEIRLPVGFGTLDCVSVHVIVAPPAAMSPSTVAPCACVIATTGIVTGVPSGMPGGGVAVGATVGLMKPAALLYRITPAAPAVSALIALL